MRGGESFIVRGINYSPLLSYAERHTSPPDMFHSTPTNEAIWARDLPLIRDMGANTIRIYNWDPSSKTAELHFLDSCHEHGLAVVLGISNYFFDNPSHVPDIVRQVAHHPALLMWAVTNEKVHAGASNGDRSAAYSQIASMTQTVRQTEQEEGTWHPISVPVTCDLGHIDDLESSGATVDVNAFQCYWGDGETWPADFYDQYAARTTKPLVITEFGVDSYDNNAGGAAEAAQAAHLRGKWSNLIGPPASGYVSSGGLVFEWMDEPWKGFVRADANAAHGGACSPDRGGLHAGWAPNALPDGCGNEAFFGVAELQSDDTLRLKPTYHEIRQAWADADDGGLASPRLPPSPPQPPTAPLGDSSAISLMVFVVGGLAVLAAVLCASGVLLCARRRKRKLSSNLSRGASGWNVTSSSSTAASSSKWGARPADPKLQGHMQQSTRAPAAAPKAPAPGLVTTGL